ncbi:uncharacterized transporter slc-17.2-like [Haliotis rufescens]|uniref:uncharacterized transporter slc-17.2-like n=1 Tax=Haliotis rufescens TaxID=6454 RepID=UPI00201E80C2|nr:uncharacterized transporter slc-17.2-like [Haliotis rufescens]
MEKMSGATVTEEASWLLLSDSSSDDEEAPYQNANEETFFEKYTSCRWVTGYLCCLVRLALSAQRQCMGMAVVVMTMSHTGPEVTSRQSVAGNDTSSDQLLNNQTSEFTWTSDFEGLILSSFDFGFLASPIIGGYIAGTHGGKNVITVTLVVGSIVTIATPVAARALPMSLVIARVAVGFCMGPIDPATQSLLSKWAPNIEKASLASAAYSGANIAGVLTFFISGYLGGVSMDNGWPLIFYVFGGYTLLCVFPWVLFVSECPRDHPHITETELKLITRDQTAGQKDREAHVEAAMVEDGHVTGVLGHLRRPHLSRLGDVMYHVLPAKIHESDAQVRH